MSAKESKNFDFTLNGFDDTTETVYYDYTADSSVESALHFVCNPLTNPYGCRLTLEADNQTGQALVGNVYVIADIEDINTTETLRTYTATINLTIDGAEPSSPVTVTPTTVSENGIVGQSTAFYLTLTGGTTYTYTQTFGNICSVSINENIATVRITPTTSGTLTGSITFNNEATCNITIDVAEPQPTGGFEPSTVTYTMSAQETKTFDFTLLGYDSETEGVRYNCEKSIEDPSLTVDFTPLYNPDGCQIIIESDNETEQAEVLNVYVTAEIFDKHTHETLRTYTATINLTIEAYPEP